MWIITNAWYPEELNKLLKEGWEPFSVVKQDAMIPNLQYWLKKQVEFFVEVGN